MKAKTKKQKTVRLACYGTLRKGFFNYEWFSLDQCKFVAKGYLNGFVMYSNAFQNFPALSVGKGRVFVEIYDVPAGTARKITDMEVAYVYKPVKVKLPKHGTVTIYAMDLSERRQNGSTVVEVWRDLDDPNIGWPVTGKKLN